MRKDEYTKGRIAACARDIISWEGSEKLSVQNLAKKCRISKSTFYKFFPSKEALLKFLESDGDLSPVNGIQDVKGLISWNALEELSGKQSGTPAMRDIANAAGYKTSSLYHHFTNKTDLFHHILRTKLRDPASRHMSQTGAHTDADVHADADVHTGMEMGKEKGMDLQLLEVLQNWIDILALPEYQTISVELIQGYFEDRKAKGHLPAIIEGLSENLERALEAGKQKGHVEKSVDIDAVTRLMTLMNYGLMIYTYLSEDLQEDRNFESLVLGFLQSMLETGNFAPPAEK